jgi:hypothetical protein
MPLIRRRTTRRPGPFALAALLLALADCGSQSVSTPCDSSGDATCFSPCQNLKRALEPGMAGCACAPGVDEPSCFADDTGRTVALTCESDGAWHAEERSCTPGA